MYNVCIISKSENSRGGKLFGKEIPRLEDGFMVCLGSLSISGQTMDENNTKYSCKEPDKRMC